MPPYIVLHEFPQFQRLPKPWPIPIIIKQIAALSDLAAQTAWKQRESIVRKMNVESEFELSRLTGRWPGGQPR